MAVVVPITASADCLRELSQVHRRAFAGSFTVALGSRYVRAMLGWFCSAPERIALKAVGDDGRAVGYVFGAPVGYAGQMSRELASAALAGILWHPWLLGHAEFRAKLKTRIQLLAGRSNKTLATPVLPEPCVALVGIGVDHSARAQGVGSQLMDAFESQCRTRGARSMRLSVRDENQAAISLYTRHGWSRCPEPLEIPGAHYYAKQLN